MEWVLPLRHEALTPIFLALTALGDTLFYLVALATLYWLGDRATFRRLAFLLTVSAFCNSWLKVFFAVPRPTSIPWLAEADGYSFPSGHAQIAAFTWLWLALCFRRRWLSLLAAVLVVGIAASRVYLGVHTPTDVFAGMAIGGLTVALTWRWAHQPPAAWLGLPASLRFLAWAVAIAIGLATFPGPLDHIAVVASGALLGFELGYLMGPSGGAPLAPGWRRAAAVALGLAVALLLRVAGKILLGAAGLPPEVADFLRYFAIALWVIWLAPLAFARLRLTV